MSCSPDRRHMPDENPRKTFRLLLYNVQKSVGTSQVGIGWIDNGDIKTNWPQCDIIAATYHIVRYTNQKSYKRGICDTKQRDNTIVPYIQLCVTHNWQPSHIVPIIPNVLEMTELVEVKGRSGKPCSRSVADYTSGHNASPHSSSLPLTSFGIIRITNTRAE